MIVNNVTLEAVGVRREQYPIKGYSEIAFVGRSNVGKSTLINAMIYRKALARTSQSPGKTRTINFYNVEEQLYFVDLPGYGYARASKSETEKWGNMIEEYLLQRDSLKAIVMLVDIRHKPNANDIIMFDFLKHYKYNMVIVATKSDKINRSQIQKQIAIIRSELNLPSADMIIPFSGETKQGRDELWARIEKNLLP